MWQRLQIFLAVLGVYGIYSLLHNTFMLHFHQEQDLSTRVSSTDISTSLAMTNTVPIKVVNASFTPGKLHIVTLADNPTREELCPSAASLYTQGYVLGVLGWNYSDTFFDKKTCGTPCQANRDHNNRFGQQKKLHWLHYYLEHHPSLHDDDLVLFTDAWDVIVNGNVSTIPQLFLKQTMGKRGVIFNGEPSCGDSFGMNGHYGDKLREKQWPIRLHKEQKLHYANGRDMCYAIAVKTMISTPISGPNWSLGSGGIVGDVATVREFLRRVHQIRIEQELEYAKNPEQSFLFEGDQILFQLAYLRFPEINAIIDTQAEIFFVLSFLVGEGDFTEFSMEKGCTMNYLANNIGSKFTLNNITPIFFHFPGSSKRHLNQCFSCVARERAHLRPNQYFMDIDRQQNVSIHDVCQRYA
ncbi:hypothetical protein THRCLA_01932 [Thraustotheca clavata]|uniref:PLOD1-3-like GT domain-containing protein n=1 Tax=Thraustotheca clavata TaxID=74557 RepID=A0A1W0A6W7_9STRA|nr:hypothetical protein THRCLA_01932 [Thraustotheca clavata]